ncbi:MAG TPA: twin-arginine translocase TatA/TatE family subunit [Thermodesulfovibrionales bacterium]|nr:twin-arginine translocase TatA/TatE family subunit [Thermodesulfovibrionales bacterium]
MFRGLFQPMHLVVILVIVLIIFGPSRLAELGGSLGKAIKDFKKGISSDNDAVIDVKKEAAKSDEASDKKTT